MLFNHQKKVIAGLFLCLLLCLLSSCSMNMNLGYFFKKVIVDKTMGRVDFGKTLLTTKTPQYSLTIRENRTTYCPTSFSRWSTKKDTIQFKNQRLKTVIGFLMQENKTVTRFSFFDYNPKIDLVFISNSVNPDDNIEKLINSLKQTFNFNIQKENANYQLRVVDSAKLRLATTKKSTLLLKKAEIVFLNHDFPAIAGAIGADYNIFIQHEGNDNKKYSLTSPRHDIEQLKKALQEQGFELESVPANDKFVAIEFNKK